MYCLMSPFMFSIVVQRAVGYRLDINLFRLAHPCHVGQYEFIGMNIIERYRILGNHRQIHLFIECFYLLLIIHLFIG